MLHTILWPLQMYRNGYLWYVGLKSTRPPQGLGMTRIRFVVGLCLGLIAGYLLGTPVACVVVLFLIYLQGFVIAAAYDHEVSELLDWGYMCGSGVFAGVLLELFYDFFLRR
ncbi:MAG TPA: hypothetical protein VLI92_05155 [Candidatus Saccharimonadales bacterium]|nr:hypothetical protein [Candidatus Saccharimonadales bacterium]